MRQFVEASWFDECFMNARVIQHVRYCKYSSLLDELARRAGFVVMYETY